MAPFARWWGYTTTTKRLICSCSTILNISEGGVALLTIATLLAQHLHIQFLLISSCLSLRSHFSLPRARRIPVFCGDSMNGAYCIREKYIMKGHTLLCGNRFDQLASPPSTFVRDSLAVACVGALQKALKNYLLVIPTSAEQSKRVSSLALSPCVPLFVAVTKIKWEPISATNKRMNLSNISSAHISLGNTFDVHRISAKFKWVVTWVAHTNELNVLKSIRSHMTKLNRIERNSKQWAPNTRTEFIAPLHQILNMMCDAINTNHRVTTSTTSCPFGKHKTVSLASRQCFILADIFSVGRHVAHQTWFYANNLFDRMTPTPTTMMMMWILTSNGDLHFFN